MLNRAEQGMSAVNLLGATDDYPIEVITYTDIDYLLSPSPHVVPDLQAEWTN